MRTFRSFLHSTPGKWLILAILFVSTTAFIDTSTYLYALEVQRQKDAEIEDIAKKLGVDPEFLRNPNGRASFDFRGLFASIKYLFSTPEETSAVPTDIRAEIEKIKARYALVAADATLAKVAALIELAGRTPATRGKKKGQIRAEANSILRLVDKDFLPPVKEGLPGVASARHGEMSSRVASLRQTVKAILKAPHALDDANLDGTLQQLKAALAGTLTIPKGHPRWTRDAFPLKDTYAALPQKAAGPVYGTNAVGQTAAPKTLSMTPASQPAAEVAALAQTLGTAAKVFAFVHDRIEWEPYSGVAKGALGTLKEGRGNDWDQALLVRDMLRTLGYEANLEWGTVTLPIAQAMNLVGTEAPLQAANLFATAGFEGIALTSNNIVTAIQMKHVWVRARIPYIPNRGVTPGTPDTWVRMDPSFKRYEYAPGIAINGKVAWSEDEYLQTSAVRAPAEFYGEKIWTWLRASGIRCENLDQVAKRGSIVAENFPYVPGTLTARVEGATTIAAEPPATEVQTVTMTLSTPEGAAVASYTATVAGLWGRKLSLGFPAATADDQAIIDGYGGLFSTPAYLVRLAPVLMLDDAPVVTGNPIAAGAALELRIAFRQPNVAEDFARHDVIAGETQVSVFDPGAVPDSLLQARIERVKMLAAQPPSAARDEAILSEKLYLVGLRYMQHVDDGVAFAAGVRWQRAVKRTFEASIRREVNVSYNVFGAPLRLTPAEMNIDVARLQVGIVPIQSSLANRAEALALAGLESSYREGAIWEEMESQRGISAAKALLLARMNGQQLYTADSSNLESVLAAANLPADVEEEIRGAVGQGRIAKLAAGTVSLGRWSGTGYILADPRTGAATYPISGGMAGGSTTGEAIAGIKELLGSEPWLDGSPLGALLRELLALLGGGDGGGTDGPSTTKSDPVNLSSGNMFRTATDVSIIARGIPVALSRTYNSRSAYNGPLGYGWTFNYGESLAENGDGFVTYREADGTEHWFAKDGTGSFGSPVGKHLTLTPAGSGWTLRFKNGLEYGFDAAGLLVSQRDLNGNTVAINRNAAGEITTVADATGRTVLTFAYMNGRIAQVTDLGSRSVVFGYTGDDLTAVTDAAGKIWTYTYDLGHNMTSFSDPLGNTQSYDYDTDDRLFHHVDATGAEEFFQYDIAGRQAVLTEQRGGDRYIRFDDLGRATLEADPAGNVVKATWTEGNDRSAVTDSRGYTTSYEFDDAGNLTKQTNPDSGYSTTTYDENSRPLTQRDALGVTTTNTYDTSGNLLTTKRNVNGVDEVTTNTYDARGQLLTTEDPMHAVTTMTWNPNGTLATREDALHHVTTIGTDDLGRITSMKDPMQNETVLTYDAKDRIATLKDPDGKTTSFVYDDAGRRTSATTPRGTTTYTYDGEGRVLTTTDALGNRTATTYDAAGNVLTRTDARGNVTRYEYDLTGRVTKMTDANGQVWSYGYCASLGGGGGAGCSSCGSGGGGGWCEITDPNGKVIKREFDVMGRVATVTDSLSHTARTEYDKAGRKTLETDANGHATAFGYDEAGRLVSVTEASGAVTSYTYDANGNKLTQKVANGHVWTYAYDVLNRLREEKDPLLRKATYTYDALGNLETKTDAKGQTTTYTYERRRIKTVAYQDGVVDSYTYNALGQRVGMANNVASYTYEYDTLGRTTKVVNTKWANATLLYEYDANGNRKAMTTVKGRVEYVYDSKGNLTTIVDPVLGSFTFAYDGMDRRQSLTYPNGVVTSYDYDDAYRLTAIASKDAAGTIADAWSYAYDAAGNRTSKTDMSGLVEHYTYDAVDRLTEARYGDGTFEQFGYDFAGNRTTKTTAEGTVLYIYDIANQLLASGLDTFTYDANGSLVQQKKSDGTWKFTYDAANRTARIDTPTAWEVSQWAPDGRRSYANSWLWNAEIEPQYDLQGNPVLDLQGSGTQVMVYRVYGPGLDEVLGEWRPSGNVSSYMLHDALGSITAATNAAGQVTYREKYKAFGERTDIASPGVTPSRLSYTGRENSWGTLMQYRSRYYDTSVGRFTQRDSYHGNDLAPPSLHRYVYAQNNPVLYVDPNGNTAVLVASLVGLAVIATAVAMSHPELVARRAELVREHLQDVWDSLGTVRASFMAGIVLAVAWTQALTFSEIAASEESNVGTFSGVRGGYRSRDCFTRLKISLAWIRLTYPDNPEARAVLYGWAVNAFTICLSNPDVIFPGEPGWIVRGGI